MVANLPIRPALSKRESPHERNRMVLFALSDDASVVSIFDACGVQRGWWTANREWKRSFSRYHPDRQMIADLVFVSDQTPQALCRVELSCNPPSTTSANGFVVETDFGFARCTRSPEDPRLAGLRKVAAPGGVVTRYHPSQRCTLRVQTDDRGTVFAKVYANREKCRTTKKGTELVALKFWPSASIIRGSLGAGLFWLSDGKSRGKTLLLAKGG